MFYGITAMGVIDRSCPWWDSRGSLVRSLDPLVPPMSRAFLWGGSHRRRVDLPLSILRRLK